MAGKPAHGGINTADPDLAPYAGPVEERRNKYPVSALEKMHT